MNNYIKIGENLYTNNKHHYITKNCDYCNNVFYCRKDKINTKKTCNSKCHQNLIEKNNTYEFNKNELDIIVGSLLSDGCVSKSYNAKNYRFSHISMHEEYIDYLKLQLNFDMSKNKISPSYIDIGKKKYLSNGSYIIKSKSSPTFTEIRNIWYPYNKKIVPAYIDITPTVLLHWYLGDGNICNSNGITLCTDNFDENSIDILLEKLYELDFLPNKNKKNRIIIPNKRVFEFLKYIGNCPISCFNYKWNTIIEESYKNRLCINCGTIFNCNYNHQKYCCDKCSKSNNYKIKTRKFI